MGRMKETLISSGIHPHYDNTYVRRTIGDGSYTISDVKTGTGVFKIKLIKYVRSNSGMGLKEAGDVVMAVYEGKTLPEVLDMCEDGTPKYIIEDMYQMALQDKFETEEVQKTTLGKYLYV